MEANTNNQVDDWKRIAAVAIFGCGCIGCGAAPMLRRLNRSRHSGVAGVAVAGVVDGAGSERSVGSCGDSGSAVVSDGCGKDRLAVERLVIAAERLVTSFGCGVMLATGFVHVLADAEGDIASSGWVMLSGDNQFPLAQTLCVAAVLLIYFFHIEIHKQVDHAKQPLARMHILESGLIVHSVLIGFALGTSSDLHGLRGLTIAMMFHQLCEGFALGGAVKEAGLLRDTTGNGAAISGRYQTLMVLLFGLSTPIGILIGWFAIASEASAESTASVGFQGILSSLAAGILICAALCDFMPALYSDHGHDNHRAAATHHLQPGEIMRSTSSIAEPLPFALRAEALPPASIAEALPHASVADELPTVSTAEALPATITEAPGPASISIAEVPPTTTPAPSPALAGASPQHPWEALSDSMRARLMLHAGVFAGALAMSVVAIWA